MKSIIFLLLIFQTNRVIGQDTIRVLQKPNFKIKSWHPEYKDFPSVKIGDIKIFFTYIPEFENLPLRDNDINLYTINCDSEIEETIKSNQFQIKVLETKEKFVEFEAWLDIGDNVILIYSNNKWENIKELYKVKENRVLIKKFKLKLVK